MSKQTKDKTQKVNMPGEKLFYRFDEAARLTGVDTRTIEAWEKEFPFLTAGVTSSGDKFFRRQDIAIIGRIKELQSCRTLTQAGIKRRIEEEFGLAKPVTVHPEKIQKTLVMVREGLEEMLTLLSKAPKKG